MKLNIIIVFLLAVFLSSFIYFGLPKLKEIREQKNANLSISFTDDKTTEGRAVQIDISIEDICINIVTGEPDIKCQGTENCDRMCKEKGCGMFGLFYNNSEYKNKRCFCGCIEPNKIKNALNID
ncbi:MAG: hypothetical protein QXK37_03495 [Candidatus Woesearchaeota archaeon]